MQVGVMMLEVKQKDKDKSNKLGRLSVSREQATGQASYKDPAAQLTCSLLGLALKGKQNKDREKKNQAKLVFVTMLNHSLLPFPPGHQTVHWMAPC